MSLSRLVIAAVGGLTLLSSCSDPEVILTGERLDLRADLDAGSVAPGATDNAANIVLPPQSANAVWSHKAGNPAHDPRHPALSQTPGPVWSVSIGQGEDRRHRITADPVVSDGRIFTVDSRARVMAHSTSGAQVWSVDLTPPTDSSDDASGAGLAISGNRVFVSTGFGDLVALDATSGARLWTQELDASAAGAPTVVGDLAYLVTRDALAWAIDVSDGRVAWTLPGTTSASGVVGGAAPAVGDTLAVFPFASGELVAAERGSGARVWGSNVAGSRLGRVYALVSDISGDPVIAAGRVFAGSPSGRTVAVDLASGETVWSAPEGAMSPVSVFGGSVFAVSDRAELVRLDAATGDRIWGTELPFFVKSTSRKRKAVYGNYGPLLAGGQLWVASGDGALRAFSPRSGDLSQSIVLTDGAVTNPVVVGQTLYLVTADGKLHAFR